MKLEDARRIGNNLLNRLVEHCEAIHIVGSVRRKEPEVKDVELLVIPRLDGDVNLFHEGVVDMLAHDNITERLNKNGRKIASVRLGAKEMALSYQNIPVDLFVTDEDHLGFQKWLRTGPAAANKFMMQNPPAGLRVPGLMFYKGQMSKGKRELFARDERQMFEILRLMYLIPEARSVENYRIARKQFEELKAKRFE
jgi:DNA polymerase/3'-5' exonuclease PolX